MSQAPVVSAVEPTILMIDFTAQIGYMPLSMALGLFTEPAVVPVDDEPEEKCPIEVEHSHENECCYCCHEHEACSEHRCSHEHCCRNENCCPDRQCCSTQHCSSTHQCCFDECCSGRKCCHEQKQPGDKDSNEAKEKEKPSCPICADDFVDPVKLIHEAQPEVNHIFCKTCIQNWFFQPSRMNEGKLVFANTTCPSCRHDSLDSDLATSVYFKVMDMDGHLSYLRESFGAKRCYKTSILKDGLKFDLQAAVMYVGSKHLDDDLPAILAKLKEKLEKLKNFFLKDTHYLDPAVLAKALQEIALVAKAAREYARVAKKHAAQDEEERRRHARLEVAKAERGALLKMRATLQDCEEILTINGRIDDLDARIRTLEAAEDAEVESADLEMTGV